MTGPVRRLLAGIAAELLCEELYEITSLTSVVFNLKSYYLLRALKCPGNMILCLYFRMEKNMAEKTPINFLALERSRLAVLEPGSVLQVKRPRKRITCL